jgi:hypothetical protein
LAGSTAGLSQHYEMQAVHFQIKKGFAYSNNRIRIASYFAMMVFSKK